MAIPVGGIIAASAIGNFLSARSQSRSASKNYAAQLQNARDDRKWNAQQAEIARSEQDRRARDLMRDEYSIRSAGAKAAGLHPLAVLGSSVASPPPAVIGGQSNLGSVRKDATASAAGSVAKALGNAPMMALQHQLLAAQIRNVDADTQRTLSDIASKSNPAGPQPNPFVDSNLQDWDQLNQTFQQAATHNKGAEPSSIPVIKDIPGRSRTIETTMFGALDLMDQGKTPISVLEEVIGESADIEGAARVVAAVVERSGKTGALAHMRKLAEQQRARTNSALKKFKLDNVLKVLEAAVKYRPMGYSRAPRAKGPNPRYRR